MPSDMHRGAFRPRTAPHRHRQAGSIGAGQPAFGEEKPTIIKNYSSSIRRLKLYLSKYHLLFSIGAGSRYSNTKLSLSSFTIVKTEGYSSSESNTIVFITTHAPASIRVNIMIYPIFHKPQIPKLIIHIVLIKDISI